MQLDWMTSEPVQHLLRAYAAHDVELRFVGGCVRDSVLGRVVKDIDVATPALPERVMEVAKKENLKAIPTGIDHGTVTIVIDAQPFEITTLRKDIACDGRHADVEYTDDWQQDASRRDFTMNALYMDADGTIIDFFDGISDAKAGQIKFIGDAEQRIKEDGLRILRFFRFLATHGADKIDSGALAACEANKAMLADLSGERIHKEMMKLLSADNPLVALRAGQSVDLWSLIFMDDVFAIEVLDKLVNYEQADDVALDPLLRITLLMKRDSHAIGALIERWKCSNQEKKVLQSYANAPLIDVAMNEQEQKKYIRKLGAELFVSSVVMSAITQHVDIKDYESIITLANTWHVPDFPVRGADLKAQGFADGPALGVALKDLEALWEASEYNLSKDDLLAKVSELNSQ